jgi:hypothetical protein
MEDVAMVSPYALLFSQELPSDGAIRDAGISKVDIQIAWSRYNRSIEQSLLTRGLADAVFRKQCLDQLQIGERNYAYIMSQLSSPGARTG